MSFLKNSSPVWATATKPETAEKLLISVICTSHNSNSTALSSPPVPVRRTKRQSLRNCPDWFSDLFHHRHQLCSECPRENSQSHLYPVSSKNDFRNEGGIYLIPFVPFWPVRPKPHNPLLSPAHSPASWFGPHRFGLLDPITFIFPTTLFNSVSI